MGVARSKTKNRALPGLTKTNAANIVWVFALCSLILIRFWLVSSQALNGAGEAPHDAGLFFRLAVELINGNWLGNYDSLTLAKGPVYSMWMALVYWLNLPLLFAQQLLYTVACALFALALRPLINNRFWLGILFLVLLFNPMSYSGGIGPAARIIRGGIYTSLTLLVLAGAIGLVTQALKPNRSKVFWSGLLGCSLPLFWMTREEGLWVLPAVILLSGTAVFLYWFSGFRRLIQYWPLFMSLILTLCLMGIVSAINYRNYDYWGVVDMKSSGFQSAYGALGRVKHEHWKADVPVPVDARNKLYRLSPQFAEFEEIMEGDFFSGLRRTSRDHLDFGGGWFIWALRMAVQNAGYYQSAETAEKVYLTMANEINRACEKQQVSCYGKRTSLMPPMHYAYLRPFFLNMIDVYYYLVGFEGFVAINSNSTGPLETLLFYPKVTHNLLEPYKEIQDKSDWLFIAGWAFHETLPLRFEIINENRHKMEMIERRLNSYEIFERFANKGRLVENARIANFDIAYQCPTKCSLVVKNSDNEIMVETALQQPFGSIDREGIQGQLIHSGKLYDVFVERNHAVWQIKINRLTDLQKLYHIGIPFLFPAAIFFIIILTAVTIVKREKKEMVYMMVVLSLGVSMLIRISLVSLIDITSFPAINTLYLAPAYPLVIGLVFMAFYWTATRGKEILMGLAGNLEKN